jgi:hypothetical protein
MKKESKGYVNRGGIYTAPILNTPYFPFLRARLAARGRRTFQTLRRLSLPQLGQCLEAYLPVHLFSGEDQGANSRDRVYSLGLTIQCFIWQMLKPRTSCREVVRQVRALFGLNDLGSVKEGSSAYCQARLRLPQERLENALTHLAQQANRRAAPTRLLQGRTVKVVDGTTVQAADTAANRKTYPQSPHQRRGCGFPLIKILALFSLSSGAILKVITGNFHHHDLRLFHQLWEDFKKGDIVLGDRLFGDYVTLADLPPQGVDVVARLNAKRKIDYRKAKRLGRNDGLLVWRKPQNCPPYLSPARWAAIPSSITVRVLCFHIALKGCRTRWVALVTTLLDPKAYPLEQLAALYVRRWRLELCFRDLKTQMGMEQLRCQTPPMVIKELMAYLVAHNLVRCLMAQASATHLVDLERLSFKGTVDSLRQFGHAIAQANTRKKRRQLSDDLLLTIALDLVPLRPGRREPRAIKRRPKPFPLLTKPRHQFKDRIPYNRWILRQKNLRNGNLI